MSKSRRRRTIKAIPTSQGRAVAVPQGQQPRNSLNGWSYNPQQQNVPPEWWSSPFPPGYPVPPEPINTPRPGTGQQDPRLYEVEPGYNLYLTPRRHTDWRILRECADRITLFRRCIEIRKEHLQGLDWGFRVSEDALNAAAEESPGTTRVELEKSIRQQLSPDIARASAFWEMPDRGQGYDFADWLGLMLEEILVVDALTIFPQMKLNGDALHSFEIPDGTTIKPLRDDRGGRPLPPYPAYQQILYGFPRGEYTATGIADVPKGKPAPTPFTAADLIYKRRCIRNWTPYGYSAVEQALDDGDLELKRHRWMKAEYTHGAMPNTIFEVMPDAGLDPNQVAELERFFNDLLAGQTNERQKARFLPPGITPSRGEDLGERYKPDYDLFLIRKVAAHFGVTMPELNFTEPGGLGSSGYHEGQEDIQNRKELPVTKMITKLISSLTHTYLECDPSIEFYFRGLDQEDEASADALESARYHEGVLTLNERRDRLGLDRYPFPEADMAMLVLTRGVIFLEGASQLAPPGMSIEPAKAAQDTNAGDVGDQGATGEGGEEDELDDENSSGAPPANKPGTPSTPQQKQQETKAYRKWLAKGHGRAFEWHHHTADEANTIMKAEGEQSRGRPAESAGLPRVAERSTGRGLLGGQTHTSHDWSSYGRRPG